VTHRCSSHAGQISGTPQAIVRSTAEAHGGSASLSDADPGLRAEVQLPLADGF
jgi:hypothetical protein